MEHERKKTGWLRVPPRWEEALYGPPYEVADILHQKWIRQFVTPETVVLDIGAGPGNPYFQLDLRGAAKRVIGIDIDPAVMRNPHLDEAIVTDGLSFPLPDASVDVAVSTFVLEHIEDPASHLAEVRRVLKPGGHFFFLTVNARYPFVIAYRVLPRSLRDFALACFGARDAEGQNYPVYLRANTAPTLRRLAREAGFGTAEIRYREQPPNYFRAFLPLWLVGVAYEWFARKCPLMRPIATTLYGRFDKPA